MKQKTLDFNRGRQITLVRRAQLPSVVLSDGKRVTPRTMKALLTVIDSHALKEGECWATNETLAVETGLCPRSVRRGLAGLRSLGIIVERDVRNGSRNFKHRRICFPNLADFELEKDLALREAASSYFDKSHPATGSIHPATGSSHPATGSLSPGNGVLQKEKEKKERKSVKGGDGFLEMFRGEEIQERRLRDPKFLELVYRCAVSHRIVPDSDYWRRTMFGFGARCWRKRGELEAPVGFFLFGLARKSRDWLLQQVDDNDRQRGKELIDQLEGGGLQAAPQRGPSAFESEMDLERERERQQRMLAEEFGLQVGG